jgi:hypothetical protein
MPREEPFCVEQSGVEERKTVTFKIPVLAEFWIEAGSVPGDREQRERVGSSASRPSAQTVSSLTYRLYLLMYEAGAASMALIGIDRKIVHESIPEMPVE